MQLPNNLTEYFPLPQIRQKQAKCFDFVYRMVQRGITDIVLSAPTGVGKSAIGTTLGFWAAQQAMPLDGERGAYYLCTQKLLQDQLERDTMRYPPHLRLATSLKTASEYQCRAHGDCGTGLMHKPMCVAARENNCTYMRQKKAFLASDVAITNYPYFFTERCYVGQFPQRRLLIADECHTLENQLLKFIELTVGSAELDKYTPTIREVPQLVTLDAFAEWLETHYCQCLRDRLDGFDEQNLSPARARERQETMNQLNKAERAAQEFEADPQNWVYWQEVAKRADGSLDRMAIAKPLSAARYFRDMIQDTSHTRIYMSAYPGSKEVFCRTLGLDPTRVAMLTLGSVFPKENRAIHVTSVGSMSKKNQAATLPSFLRVLARLMEVHDTEKGIIHCNSYALGEAIFEYFKRHPHGHRLLFPRSADEREAVYKKHQENKFASVILSPSFTEGFDFANELARWQVLAKMPYPYLGDKQVAAKKELDPEWYAMRTVMTVIQASGRICRNETDHGTTYITDADFNFLWEKYEYMFPNWWKEALVWH